MALGDALEFDRLCTDRVRTEVFGAVEVVWLSDRRAVVSGKVRAPGVDGWLVEGGRFRLVFEVDETGVGPSFRAVTSPDTRTSWGMWDPEDGKGAIVPESVVFAVGHAVLTSYGDRPHVRLSAAARMAELRLGASRAALSAAVVLAEDAELRAVECWVAAARSAGGLESLPVALDEDLAEKVRAVLASALAVAPRGAAG